MSYSLFEDVKAWQLAQKLAVQLLRQQRQRRTVKFTPASWRPRTWDTYVQSKGLQLDVRVVHHS